MTLWERFKAVAKSPFGNIVQPRFNNWWHKFILPNTTIDFEKHVGSGIGSNVFMSPVLWVARAALEAKFGIITADNDGQTDVNLTHDIISLLRHPNKWYSGMAMMIGIWISWFTNGNVYLFKARDKTGAVKELWYCPHWLIEPWVDPASNDYITVYKYWPAGAIGSTGSAGCEEIEPSEIVHLRFGLDPRNTRKGLSHMGMLLREICNDDESANFVAALLLNGGVPGIIISPKDASMVSTEDLTATRDYVKVQFGRSKRGEPMAIGAPTDIKEFGYDPKKMDLEIVRGVSEERVCSVIGLPSGVVGFGSGNRSTKVGATLAELHRVAWLNCLIPNQELMAAELDRNLRDDFKLKDNEHLGYDRRHVRALQEDLNTESERMDRGVKTGWIKVIEAKKALGLKTDPSDDIYLRPMGVTAEGPGAPPEPEPVAPPAIDPATGKPPIPGAKPPKPGAPAADLPKSATAAENKGKHKITKRQASILKAMDKLKAKAQVKLGHRMKTFFKAYGAAAAHAFINHAKAAHDDAQVESMFNALNVNKYQKELKGILGQHYMSVHNETAGVLAQMGIGTDLPDDVQLQLLAKGGSRAGLIDLTDAAKARARIIVTEGRENNLTNDEIAKQLEDVVPAGPFLEASTRADLIARNETRIAQTESAVMLYENAEGIDQVMVIDARLGETDEDCMDANGEYASFEEAMGLIADEHPNGTRDVVPVFAN